MTAIVSTLTSLPSTQLRRNRYFYLFYDGAYAVLFASLIVLMRVTHFQPFVQHYDHRFWLILPLVCHFQILCSVFVHNCTHNNFPRPINRIIGELCGLVVLFRFASWEIIHQRHHRYSDEPERDPHPVCNGYWKFLARTVVNLELQLQQLYFDLWGDTPENRRYERIRAYVSYTTNILLIVAYWFFLGPIAFFFFAVPAEVIGFLHLIHFNWSTHNGFSRDGDFRPVNLNHGYYRVGNYLWFGIYMHANHHKRANLFNPAKMTPSLPVTAPVPARE